MSIWSFFGKMFSSDTAIKTSIETARDAFDVMVYTEEEKAQDAAKSRSEAREMVVAWMQATQGQNLVRRFIALLITLVWMSMYMISVLTGMAAVFVNNSGVVTAKKLNQVGEIAKQSAIDMNPAVMLILAFYFAAPHMGKIAEAVTDKFTGKIKER